MPLIGVNEEALYERAIFAYDGTDYRVVKCDTDGNLVAAVKADQEIEVVQDTAADLKATVDISADQNVQARGYGWDGSNWRKNPIPLGFTDIVEETLLDEDLDAGTNNLDGTAVPAGEIWRILIVNYRTVSASVSSAVARAFGLATAIIIEQQIPPTSGSWYPVQCETLLQEGDYMSLLVLNATSGDKAYMRYAGHKIKIAE